MQKYSVEVTLQAQEQMRDIALYVAKELMNRDAALGLLDAFEEAILSLEEFPERVALTSEEPWHSEKIHQLIVENYYLDFTTEACPFSIHLFSEQQYSIKIQ